MKREILFRGKRKDNGEWVYGWYCVMSGIDYIIPENEQFRNPADPDFENSFIEVYPETVGQFTGTESKYGTRIFDGDIFNIGDTKITYLVVWHDSGFTGKQMEARGYYIGLNHWSNRIELIGNIHDNPELKLEEKDESEF